MPKTKGVALAMAFATAAAWVAPVAEARSRIDHGRALAIHNCSRCHAIGARGPSRNPKAPPLRTLGRKYPLDGLEESFAEGVAVGHKGLEMPHFQFAPHDVDDLIAYIGSVQEK